MLASAGDAVVAAAASGSDGQFEHEFKREQAELGSSPQLSMSVLVDELRRRRSELGSAARASGVRLLASGTSPVDSVATSTHDERYERMSAVFGRVARMQLTCGMHVHVSIDTPEEGVGVLDRIRDWLAVLVALSANSPFLAGQDTAYASYRTVLWGQWPTAGIADPFGDVDSYRQATAALVASGAALDDGMIYFDARLSAHYPTVEIRVADVCAHVDDAGVVAALARALVATAADDWAAGRPASTARTELLRGASWRAARWGMTGDLLGIADATPVPAWTMIDRFLEHVGPALDAAGDTEQVVLGLTEIRRRGTGAGLQRAAFGRDGLIALVDAVADVTLR